LDRPRLYTIACYPGTFDPITFGHLDIIERASKLFEKVVVVVADPVHKRSLFTLEERVKMIEECIQNLSNVEVKVLQSKLLMDFCKENEIGIVIRGMRAVSDFEYEFKMAWMNRKLFPDIEVVFLLPSEEYTYLSSTLVKEIVVLGGDISSLAPMPVVSRGHLIKERIQRAGLGEENEQSL